jgi:hypothetical protein
MWQIGDSMVVYNPAVAVVFQDARKQALEGGARNSNVGTED